MKEAFLFETNTLFNKRMVIDADVNTKYEYDANDNLIYKGIAPSSASTSDQKWIIWKYIYDASGNLIDKKVAYGAWDNRASLFT